MAKRFTVVRPPGGGSPEFIPAGGGKARAGRIPKAPEASFSIDLNLAGLRESRDHQKRVKTLEESGLYEGIDLNLIDPDKVSQLYTKLPSDLAALAKSQREQEGLRARGSYFQDQADLGSEPPRHFIGSEYEKTKGTLDSPAAKDLGTLNPMTGEFEDVGKYTDPSVTESLGKELEYGPEDLVEFFGIGEGGGLKKDVRVDEDNLKHGSDTEFYPSGNIKRDSEFDRGVETSRIEYDRSGNIEKTKGDPFGTGSDDIPEKNLTRVEEDLANFLGIDPSFVTKDMYTSRTQFQKELEKPEKVIDAFKNTKEVTRYNPETNETFVKWIKKGSGKVVGKEVNPGV